MPNQGTVGLRATSTGAAADIALSRDAAQLVMLAHHSNIEAARQARCFSACTPAAGVAPGTALSTTPPWTLYNPQGSGIACALLGVSLGYISGTLGKGALVLGGNPSVTQAAQTGGTALTPQCTYLGYTGTMAQAFQGATLAAAPTLLRPLFTLEALVGAGDTALQLTEWLNGTWLLLPGCSLSLQAIAAAGTSPLVLLSGWWEEVAI